jgi:hypothetical protein
MISLTNGNNLLYYLLYYLYNHPGLLIQNFFNLGESRTINLKVGGSDPGPDPNPTDWLIGKLEDTRPSK